MTQTNMTLDEINEKLRSIGVEPNGTWKENEERDAPQFLGDIKDLAHMLREAVGHQIESDKKALAELRETLMRIQHGGGG